MPLKNVAVITGGAGGIGFATARLLGKDHHVVICDVSEQRLKSAITDLKQAGISCSSIVCDVTDRASTDAVVSMADGLGSVTSVVHTAGISPQMADPDKIIRINALGTINISESFYRVASEGFALVNVASMAAYMLPGFLIPQKAYRYAFSNPEKLLGKISFRCHLMPKPLYRRGMAYSISKNFVTWYSKASAEKFGEKNARILSVSPGTIDTEMGRLEEKSGSIAMLEKAALKRPGRPGEIAELLAFFASDRASYTTGVDILCDGGLVASKVAWRDA